MRDLERKTIAHIYRGVTHRLTEGHTLRHGKIWNNIFNGVNFHNILLVSHCIHYQVTINKNKK